MSFLIRPLESQTLGAHLRALRKRQGLALDDLSRTTHIQKAHLVAFETDQYHQLPDPRYARRLLGLFVEALNGDVDYALARFDDECGTCPTNIASLNIPRRRVRQRLMVSWRSMLTYICVAALALSVLGYLGWQLHQLLAAPALLVDSPQADFQTTSSFLSVSGQVEQEVSILVNGEPVLTDPTGRFHHEVALSRGLNLIIVEARKKYGRSTRIERRVFLESLGERVDVPSPASP